MKNAALSSGARLLKAMGKEKRLKILYYLSEKELNVGELEKLIGLSQSALSQHLAVLRAENMVKTRRSAQTIYYSLQGDKVRRVLDVVEQIYSPNYR